jgi:hypothetical protein
MYRIWKRKKRVLARKRRQVHELSIVDPLIPYSEQGHRRIWISGQTVPKKFPFSHFVIVTAMLGRLQLWGIISVSLKKLAIAIDG